MDPIAIDPVAVNEDNILYGFGKSKVDGTKIDTKTAKFKRQDKSQDKIW